jgi:hypothetical protein
MRLRSRAHGRASLNLGQSDGAVRGRMQRTRLSFTAGRRADHGQVRPSYLSTTRELSMLRCSSAIMLMRQTVISQSAFPIEV